MPLCRLCRRRPPPPAAVRPVSPAPHIARRTHPKRRPKRRRGKALPSFSATRLLASPLPFLASARVSCAPPTLRLTPPFPAAPCRSRTPSAASPTASLRSPSSPTPPFPSATPPTTRCAAAPSTAPPVFAARRSRCLTPRPHSHWQTLSIAYGGVWTDLGPNAILQVRPRLSVVAPSAVEAACIPACSGPHTPRPARPPVPHSQGANNWQLSVDAYDIEPFTDDAAQMLNSMCPCGDTWTAGTGRQLTSCPAGTAGWPVASPL